MLDDRLERALALKDAATRLSRPDTTEGRLARQLLTEETGLSPQGVDLALTHCLEHDVSRSTLSGMIRTQALRPRAHVLLSANVFTAPFRAIVLALCQSPKTHVRTSRRAQVFVRLLSEGSGEAFTIVEELSPTSGDPFWAYANDGTLEHLRANLPAGVAFHAHGSGLGAAVFRERGSTNPAELEQAIHGLVRDTILFDQRGCLSPRVVLVEGSRAFAESICDRLVEGLIRAERDVPRGRLTHQEQSDALRHEATMMYVGSCVVAGMGMVVLDPRAERVLIPPIGRYLHVTVTDNALSLLERLGPRLTTVGIYNPVHLTGQLRQVLGDLRYVDLGKMQQPSFDGPVDRRSGLRFDVL